jgi:hypothetical protein
MMMIHEGLLLILILSILYFKKQQHRYALITLYLLICCYFYFSLQRTLGLYGLYCMLFLIMTGIVQYSNEEFENCNDHEHEHEHFKNSIDKNDEEQGIEQFGISDKFSELHNMIHKITKPK